MNRKTIAPVLGEALGTAILTFAVIAVSRSAVGISYFTAIGVGLTLMVLVLLLGTISGAHVNPAVTLGLWTLRKIETTKALLYIGAQFLGAYTTFMLFDYLSDQPLVNVADSEFAWPVFLAELIGTSIFTFGIAAAVYQGHKSGQLAATIGGSLGVGILVAGVASNGLLNPAVALGVQSWSLTYVLAPLAGAILGMNLYAMVFAGEKLLPSRPVKKAATVKPTKKRKK